ncbi:MAG: hypothetical protein ACLPVO_09455 [Desulfomonilaceae bacterium]
MASKQEDYERWLGKVKKGVFRYAGQNIDDYMDYHPAEQWIKNIKPKVAVATIIALMGFSFSKPHRKQKVIRFHRGLFRLAEKYRARLGTEDEAPGDYKRFWSIIDRYIHAEKLYKTTKAG